MKKAKADAEIEIEKLRKIEEEEYKIDIEKVILFSNGGLKMILQNLRKKRMRKLLLLDKKPSNQKRK